MTINNFKWFGVMALALSLFACQKPVEKEPEQEPDPTPEVFVPEKQEINLTIGPGASAEITAEIETYADWSISADENYNWISVSPTSGAKGKNTLTFAVEQNEGKERSASYAVFQGTDLIYDVFVVQASPESKVSEGDLQFLQAIVEGGLLGEDTPTITDWVTAPDEDLTNFKGFTFDYVDGKITIVQIGESAPLTGWPEEINLPNIERIRQVSNANLAGKMLPQKGSTPKLAHICLSHTRMTGPIPQWLADSPVLSEIYFDDTDFYGALPHIWASKVLEVALLSGARNQTFTGENPYEGDNECPYMGYILPATLDVILNTERSVQGDKTQMKVGGVREGHWLGFEKGWGQKRYELFDEAAVVGDTATWSEWRLLVGKIIDEDDTNTWAWYFSSMGYPGYKTVIPQTMLDWDQAVADQFTAAAKAAHDSGTSIDMSAFGVEVVKHDDNIDKGTVIDIEDGFWTAK